MNNRNWKLDLFKSIGIISVFWGHVTEWFFFDTNAKLLKDYPKDSFQYYLPEFSINFVLVVCISLVFSAGMSLYWNTKSYQNENSKLLIIDRNGWKKLFKRFIVLFLGATIINIFNIQYSEVNFSNTSLSQIGLGLVDELSYTDVFHLVAIGTVLIPLLLTIISVKYLWIISIIFFIVQQPLILAISNFINYDQIDSNFISFCYNFLIGNYNGDSYYPIFPWMSLFSLGFFCGYLEDFNKKNIKRFFVIISIIGCIIFVPENKALVMNPENLWGAQIYVPSLSDYLGLCSIIILQYALIFAIPEKYKNVLGSNKSPLRVYSRAILFAFVFHSVVMYQGMSFAIPYINNNLQYFYIAQVVQFLLTYIFSFYWLKWRKLNVDI